MRNPLRRVVACPVCSDEFSMTGPNGVIPHILAEHPGSAFAVELRRVITDHMEERKTSP